MHVAEDVQPLVGEPDALYTFAVRARDSAGNTGLAVTGTYRLDREAPKIEAAPPATGNSREPSWSFSAIGAASLQCKLERGTELVEDWATCTSPKVWDLTGKAEGGYTFSVRAVDADGQASSVVNGSYTARHHRAGDAPLRRRAGRRRHEPVTALDVDRRRRGDVRVPHRP